jgi:hypothetical protein
MRKYLASLPNKSDKHKKRFSYIASGVFTLALFSVWCLVNFGHTGQVVADGNIGTQRVETEPAPLEGFGNGVANSLEAIKISFKQIWSSSADNAKNSIQSLDTQGGYEDLRNQVLDTSNVQ